MNKSVGNGKRKVAHVVAKSENSVLVERDQSLPFALSGRSGKPSRPTRGFAGDRNTKGSKDSMHFELQAYLKNKDGSIKAATLKPDATGVRPVRELFPLSFLMCYSPEFDDLMSE